MPIHLPEGLPAIGTLSIEGTPVVEQNSEAKHFDDVLRIGLINLMPSKTTTEIQFSRMLASSDQPVHLDLIVPDSYRSRTTSSVYLDRYYKRWSQVRNETYDGLIITGAPIEQIPFDCVKYWDDMAEIFNWARENVTSSYYICWAAQAALWHFHGVPKRDLVCKMFGVFDHWVFEPDHPLLSGLGRSIPIPVSRHTTNRFHDLPKDAGLNILLQSDQSGLGMLEDTRNNAILMFNHLEYDADTLGAEYRRDINACRTIEKPRNYFPGDDDKQMPGNTWRLGALKFFANWINVLEAKKLSGQTRLAA